MLLRFDETRETFVPLSTVSPIEEPFIDRIGADQPGHLWLSVDRLLPQHVMHPTGAAWRFFEEPADGGGVLWVGGAEGLMRVALDRAFAPAAPLGVQVNGVGFAADTRRLYA